MTDIVIAHGFSFVIEGHGFDTSAAGFDRNAGVAAIEDALLDMSRETVSAIHADAIKWMAGDCQDDEPDSLSDLAQIAWKAATNGWRNPEAAFFTVSAIAGRS